MESLLWNSYRYDITTEGPRLRRILGLGRTVLHEICGSGTVVYPLLTQKSPTCMYISQKLW